MKYIIFDIDGTLANTKKVEDKCFMKAFEETFGINIDNQKWGDLNNVTDWGITEEIVKREKSRGPYSSEYKSMILNFTQNLEEEKKKDKAQFDEISGAKDFFNKLQEMNNIALGIATGSWEKSANIKLAAIGIDMENISFSNSNYFKSREEITKDVIEQLKSKTQQTPEKITYFGDGEWDFKTCQNLGIDFIGIDVEGDNKLKNLGAKVVFNNYLNQQEILNEINNLL